MNVKFSKSIITGFLVLLLLNTASSYGQQSKTVAWPMVTKENKPWTRWWWEGSAVNKADLKAAMEKYQQAGLGGLEITPIYGVRGTEDQFIDFLSPKWIDMLEYTLQEGKRLNLGIDMATGTGWPFGGPWVTPEDACKDINMKSYTLSSGESLKENIKFLQQPMVRTSGGKQVDIKTLAFPVAANKNMQEYAFDQVKYEKELPLVLCMAYSAKGESVNLTSKVDASGKLNWVAPEGNWNMYALFQGWHGKLVERAAPGGEGDVIDHFSLKALQNYLDHFDKALKGRNITGLRAFFNDSYEVDDARGQANWTPDFLTEFSKRRGYDLREHIPALFQKDDEEKNSRVIYDYRQTISELLLEKFTGPWHSWAKAKGNIIRNQSHGSPANIMDLYGAIDIPETEGENILRFKFATSAAHVLGKPLASAETATWLNEHFQSSLGDVKLMLDRFFTGGVNHVFYHGTNYSPQQDAWPGWLFYAAVHFTPANPFWKDFHALNSYVTRVQSFLQKGKTDNDVLLYFPIHDRFSDPGKVLLQHFDGMEGFENTGFKFGAEFLLKQGYAFDLISDKQLLQVKSLNQQIQTGGVSYQTIVLADTKFLPLETWNQLKQLAGNGATIIFHKSVPLLVPGYGVDKKQATLDKLLASLSFKPAAGQDSIKKAVVGKGAFLSGEDLSQLLSFAKIRRESMVDKNLLFVRRSMDNGNTYFISNSGKEKLEGWVPVAAKFSTAALYNPMSGESGLARINKGADGSKEVFLQLAPGESCIVQTSPVALNGKQYPYLNPAGKAETVNGPWEIKFIEGGPVLPAALQVNELGSWTNLAGEDVKKFSGTAQYSVHLKKPSFKANAWLLDLGKVEESAEVLLNGKVLATLIGPSFQVIIPASKLIDDNLLQINVTNGMANRIADMDKRGVEWKKFYNVNFPARLADNRNANGLFDASKWQPKSSGLTGPVTMTPLQ